MPYSPTCLPAPEPRRAPSDAVAKLGAVAAGLVVLLATADALTEPRSPAPSARLVGQADCLWYAARNHGFLPVQTRVVQTFVDARTRGGQAASTAERVWWEGFVSSVGARECGADAHEPGNLLAALAVTADDAERLLLGAER